MKKQEENILPKYKKLGEEIFNLSKTMSDEEIRKKYGFTPGLIYQAKRWYEQNKKS